MENIITQDKIEFREVRLEDIHKAYEIMERAFHGELRSYQLMYELTKNNRCKVYGLYLDGKLIGGCNLLVGLDNWMCGDYFAIDPQYRNRGFGSRVVNMLKKASGCKVLFFDVEDPRDSSDEAMSLRRIAFYERCGMKLLDMETWFTGAHYRTMADSYVDLDELELQYRYIYINMYSQEVFDKDIRIRKNV